MKASIPYLNNGGLGLFDPGLDIVWPGENFDIKNHFELTSFELSDSEVEPFEEVTIEVPGEYAGVVQSEFGKRKGLVTSQDILDDGSTQLV